MSSFEIIQDLKMLTKSLMRREGIQRYELQIHGYCEKGENFLGDVVFFTVINSNTNRKHNLVMKTAKRSEDIRKTIPVVHAYKRESFMYREMFPAIKEFLKSVGNSVKMDYISKVFLVFDEEGRECVILEDLRDLGYHVIDRSKTMDLEHVLLVLKTLGKHHAVSIAMKKKLPTVFEEKAKHLTSVWNNCFDAMDNDAVFQPPIKIVCEMLRKRGRNELADKIEEKFEKNISSLLHIEAPVEYCLAICHGDCWMNNMMFKYKESDAGKPTGICFIDFQFSMLDSPIKDISYFIYSACDKFLLEKFDHLLRIYYESLCATLKLLGCLPEECLTYECLLDHWKKYGIFGLIMSTFVLKVELLKPEEALDLAHLLGNDSQSPEANTVKMENQEVYNNRIFDCFVHFGERFL